MWIPVLNSSCQGGQQVPLLEELSHWAKGITKYVITNGGTICIVHMNSAAYIPPTVSYTPKRKYLYFGPRSCQLHLIPESSSNKCLLGLGQHRPHRPQIPLSSLHHLSAPPQEERYLTFLFLQRFNSPLNVSSRLDT